MFKLEIGKKFEAQAGSNFTGFTCIASNQLESPPTFICRATGNFLREFYENGTPCYGNVWTVYESPPKPREFYAIVLSNEVDRGRSAHSGWIYSDRPEHGDGASQWSEVIKVIEVLPNSSGA